MVINSINIKDRIIYNISNIDLITEIFMNKLLI